MAFISLSSVELEQEQTGLLVRRRYFYAVHKDEQGLTGEIGGMGETWGV